jgi:hypothetical protein
LFKLILRVDLRGIIHRIRWAAVVYCQDQGSGFRDQKAEEENDKEYEYE